MNLRTAATIAGAASCMMMMAACTSTYAQGTKNQELALLLANDSTRQGAVAQILASKNSAVPRLLSWARNPPAQIDKYGLYIGLADAFGQLKTKEAIPFLIKNISIRRTRFADLSPWLKMPKAVEQTFPAVGALIQIGPDASNAIIRASREPMPAEDRLAAIFAVSRIKDTPEARAFLNSALGEANLERYWAEEGLKGLSETAQP